MPEEERQPVAPLGQQLVSSSDLHNLVDATLDLCLAASPPLPNRDKNGDFPSRVLQILKEDSSDHIATQDRDQQGDCGETAESRIAEATTDTAANKEGTGLSRLPSEVLGSILKHAAWLCTLSNSPGKQKPLASNADNAVPVMSAYQAQSEYQNNSYRSRNANRRSAHQLGYVRCLSYARCGTRL